MNYVLITGSSGLVGSEAVDFFVKRNFKILAIDNNMRKYFFGKLIFSDSTIIGL